jgi:CheY-like chemotaxis protein
VVFANYVMEHQVDRGAKPLVLIVDDERHIVDLLTELLEDEGYRVLSAYDGVGALEIVNGQGDLDLVLADIMMPRLDGLGLLSQVRERNASLPFVLMSAAVTPLTHDAPYISKPFEIDELLAVLAKQLAR